MTPWTVGSPDSSVHGILQARILEWVANSFSRGSARTQGSNPGLLHCRQILYHLSLRVPPVSPQNVCSGPFSCFCKGLPEGSPIPTSKPTEKISKGHEEDVYKRRNINIHMAGSIHIRKHSCQPVMKEKTNLRF